MKDEIIKRIRTALKHAKPNTLGYNNLLEHLAAVERVPKKTIDIITQYIAFIWAEGP